MIIEDDIVETDVFSVGELDEDGQLPVEFFNPAEGHYTFFMDVIDLEIMANAMDYEIKPRGGFN